MRNLIILSMILAIAGCSGTDEDMDLTTPYITSVSPPEGAVNVPRNSTIKVLFSKWMDSASIDNNDISVTFNNTSSVVSGNFVYGGSYATFTPSFSNLSSNTNYSVTVSGNIKDGRGNMLYPPKSWSFMTGYLTNQTVSFSTDIQPIFNLSCATAVCHIRGSNQLSLSQQGETEGYVYGNLMNQKAYRTLTSVFAANSSIYRVKPGDSANSALYQTVSNIGLPAGASAMPKGGTPIDPSKIKTWIDEGALNN